MAGVKLPFQPCTITTNRYIGKTRMRLFEWNLEAGPSHRRGTIN